MRGGGPGRVQRGGERPTAADEGSRFAPLLRGSFRLLFYTRCSKEAESSGDDERYTGVGGCANLGGGGESNGVYELAFTPARGRRRPWRDGAGGP